MSLGQRIRELREKRGLTQKYIADRLGMGRSNFGHIENDRVTPSSDDLEKIADILNTSADYLLGRTDDPSPQKGEIPSWATKKDVRDFKKMLEEDADLMFDGMPLDEEDRERIKQVLTALFWDAKKRNKRKKPNE